MSLLSRMGMVSGSAILGLSTTGCMGETTYDQGEDTAFEPFCTYRADRLEQYQKDHFEVDIRTMNAPGPHNAVVHSPIVSFSDGLVTAKVDHVMELDHWITTVYARDIDTGRVFFLKEFHPTEVDEEYWKRSDDYNTFASRNLPFCDFRLL